MNEPTQSPKEVSEVAFRASTDADFTRRPAQLELAIQLNERAAIDGEERYRKGHMHAVEVCRFRLRSALARQSGNVAVAQRMERIESRSIDSAE